MYVRKTTRRYKGKTYQNYLLVESVATPKGPRQKVVCSMEGAGGSTRSTDSTMLPFNRPK